MKKISILLLLISSHIFSQPTEIIINGGIQDNNTTLNNVLSDAIDNLNGDGTITIKGDVFIENNFTIPEQIDLFFFRGNKIMIKAGIELEIKGSIKAGIYQIFDGEGKVKGKPKVDNVYPEWFGAKNNDNIDDLNAIQNAIDIGNSSVNFMKGEYLISNSIKVENCKLNLNGATLKFTVDGRKECLQLRNNSSVDNGIIENDGSNPNGAGNYQSPIIVGHYGNGKGYSNIMISNLKIISNRKNGNGIMITGESSEITILNIDFPESNNLGRPILIHWGGANLTTNDPSGKRIPSNGTYHPFNITIDNIKIGKMNEDSSPDNSGIFISGAYNIKVTNAIAEEIKGDGGLITVYAGDFGNSYVNDPALKDIIMEGIIFENCGIKKAHRRLAKIDCIRGKDDFDNPDYPINNVPLPNEILKGPTFVNVWGNAISNNTIQGIGISNSSGTLIKNCMINGFLYGLVTGKYVSKLLVNGGIIKNNINRGISISNGATPPTDCIIKNVDIRHNGKEAYNSGIYIGNSIRTKVISNTIGDENDTQTWGIQIDNNAQNTIVYRNTIKFSLESGIYVNNAENAIVESNTIKFSLKSGIYVNNGKNCRILNNDIGAKQNETQTWGIRVSNDSKDNIVENNYVNNANHSAYSIGASTTYKVIYRFKGNSSSGNLSLFQTGVSPIITDTKMIENTDKKIRICLGRTFPTQGMWNKGDKVYNNFEINTSVNGWVCIKSDEIDSPAEWRTF